MEASRALPEEEFALMKALSGEPELKEFAEQALSDSHVIRERTGVGFFATFTFAQPLPSTKAAQWDWNFEHADMPAGGSFICWRDGPVSLGVEAVAHHGDWPKTFVPDKFTEAR